MIEFRTALTKEDVMTRIMEETAVMTYRNKRHPDLLMSRLKKDGFELIKSGPKGVIRGQCPFVATVSEDGGMTYIKGGFSPVPQIRRSMAVIWIVGLAGMLYSGDMARVPMITLLLMVCTFVSYFFVTRMIGRLDGEQQEAVIEFIRQNLLEGDCAGERTISSRYSDEEFK